MTDDYGLKIKNNNGVILIDSLYRNYSFEGNGTKSCSAASTSGESIETITSTSDAIVAFMKAPTDYARIVGFTESGSDYNGIRFLSSTAQSISYVYYTESLKNTTDDYGLNVYNPSNETVFSSSEDGYFNVATADTYNLSSTIIMGGNCGTNGQAYYTPTDTNDYTVEDADNNYFLITGFQFAYANCGESPDWSARYTVGIKKINSTTIRLGWFYFDSKIQTLSGGIAAAAITCSPRMIIEVKKPPVIT